MNDIQIESNKEHRASTGHRPSSMRGNRKICIEAFDLEDADMANESDAASSTKSYQPANSADKPKKRSQYLQRASTKI